ncbi:low molecular weight phosphatase family protein [Microbacterium suwonense]|uniref:Low molecular weight phosphatase family protein n=1 Tax=Microbacterium suwonense TaxID=683047 RepID=A0ABM8FU66_9MICO|nr:low molecular weight phosphatase family protein [Microbacterium suwonense]BDZ39209.1 low molecular weight phosphatase family protein [Microbacterium suwonense]
MSDPDGTTRPSLRRADLRRLRDALDHGETPLPASLAADPAARTSPGVHSAPRGTILTVCTGNICRSPMGEVLLRAQLRDAGVRVHSAGTHALVDHEMTEQAQQLAVASGADAAEAAAHRARLLTVQHLAETDLVLTMAREHRSYVVQLLPALLRRTFTVREFARLAATLTDDEVRRAVTAAGTDAGARLRALAELVGGQRGMVPAEPDNDDVIDPYRRSQTTYELSASQLVPAVAEVTRVVRAALG